MPDVAQHTVRVKPLGLQPCDGLFQRGLIDIREHQAGSAAGKLGSGGQPDAARTAGDDRSATFESVHSSNVGPNVDLWGSSSSFEHDNSTFGAYRVLFQAATRIDG